MSKIKSLNYLLLDELQKRKSKTNKKEIDEIQQKLKIIMKDNIYNIEWVFQKKNYILKLKTSDFIFYKKNDSENKVFEKTLDLNNASAQKTIDQILKMSLVENNNQKKIKINLYYKNFYKILFLLILFFVTIILNDDQSIYPSLATVLFFVIGDALKNTKRFIFIFLFIIPSLIYPNTYIFNFMSFLLPFILIYNFGQNNVIIKILFAIIVVFNFYKIDFTSIDFTKINLFIFIVFVVSNFNIFLKFNNNLFSLYAFTTLPFSFAIENHLITAVIYSVVSLLIIDLINYLEKIDFFKINISRKLV